MPRVCAEVLRHRGQAAPRYCAICGLGPCKAPIIELPDKCDCDECTGEWTPDEQEDPMSGPLSSVKPYDHAAMMRTIKDELGMSEAKQAEDPRLLEAMIMDSRIAKPAHEWWAKREIEKLREALGQILTIGSLEPCRPLEDAKYWARKALGKEPL
jgi:hypothetical protein